MDKLKKNTSIAITVFDGCGYILALYELFINHNIGVGIILSIASMVCSIFLYLFNNIDRIKKYIGGINISQSYLVLSIAHIAIWIICFLLLEICDGYLSAIMFFVFIIFNMPILFSILTKIFCYLVDENNKVYSQITFLISLILNIILFCLTLPVGERFLDKAIAVAIVIFQIIPMVIAFFINET